MLRLFLLALTLAPALMACTDGSPSATSIIPVAYTITAQSAGPITSETRYSTSTLRKLFPADRLNVIATADEGGVVNAMTVFTEGLQVMMIIPGSRGSIKAVHGSGLAVAGPNGERLGMTFRQLGMNRNSCKVGTGPWLGMAVCPSRGTSNVRLVFDNGGWDGSPRQLAPSSSLASGNLQRIVWVPPRSS